MSDQLMSYYISAEIYKVVEEAVYVFSKYASSE